MGKLILLPRARSLALAAETELPPASTESGYGLDWELLPVLGLLFVASLARVVHAVWRHEAFATEPTVALLFVVGLPWLGLRSGVKKSRS